MQLQNENNTLQVQRLEFENEKNNLPINSYFLRFQKTQNSAEDETMKFGIKNLENL